MSAEDVIRAQGVVYGAVALAVGFGATALPALAPTTEILVVGALVLVLGVPHGAFDTLWARRLLGLTGVRRWALFGLAYWAAAALVVAIWALAPVLFLGGFLIASALHFSGDLEGRVAVASRLAMGAAPLVLPSLLHEVAVARLFGLLVGPEPGALVAGALASLAWPVVFLLVGSVVWETHRDRGRTALELAATGVVAILAPPLVAFAVYFCLMHSARHVLRTARAAETTAPAALVAIAALPMLGTLALAGAAWFLLADVALDARAMQVLFVGLAALTVPHMALVEPARARGWGFAPVPRAATPGDG
ncbi:Brp/Blh family beta-carotene 15,15'-dioxygenase [Salinarimonas rosea]|uniref:Brp/Blh family beta-carotene 15,15'-dioxygenase n=1 Tax=Salinarimonas rosea TaxID=552063 RepID=UPI000420956B|nr:Brp/Blh family beta-carotene 15,15'-dioxygenase [Salinarimonas rosea]